MSAGKQDGRTAILVVDDDADIRLALEMLLQYEGFDVWTAKDGAEALARLDAEQAQGRRPAGGLDRKGSLASRPPWTSRSWAWAGSRSDAQPR